MSSTMNGFQTQRGKAIVNLILVRPRNEDKWRKLCSYLIKTDCGAAPNSTQRIVHTCVHGYKCVFKLCCAKSCFSRSMWDPLRCGMGSCSRSFLSFLSTWKMTDADKQSYAEIILSFRRPTCTRAAAIVQPLFRQLFNQSVFLQFDRKLVQL